MILNILTFTFGWVNSTVCHSVLRHGFNLFTDCTDLFNNGSRSSGIYTIKPAGSKPFQVYCLFDNEGQWTVLQRRTDGSTDFQRSWLEYRKGFGRLGGNHWLGNEYIYAITNQRQYQLRVDIADWDRNRLHATYKYFQIDAEAKNYTIHYANYTGTAGDSLTDYHQGMSFSTFDRDNDRAPREHCARLHGGGWWYNECDNGNLNGYYNYDPKLKGPTDQGIEWNSWKQLYSFKETMMRIKPTFDD